MALTSMSEDKLKSQLKKLSRLGYINYMVPGASGKHLFGVVNGRYSLNLLPDLYSSEVVRPEAIFFVANAKDNMVNARRMTWLSDFIRMHSYCFKIINEIKVKNDQGKKDQDEVVLLKKYMERKEHLIFDFQFAKKLSAFSLDTFIVNFIVLKILSISSDILSNHYSEITDGFIYCAITENTKTEFFSKMFLRSLTMPSENKPVVSEELMNQLMKLIYDIAVSFSVMVKDSLKLIDGADFTECDFHIHPSNSDTRAFVIYVVSDPSVIDKRYVCLRQALKMTPRGYTRHFNPDEIGGALVKPDECELVNKLDFTLSDCFPLAKNKMPDFSWKDKVSA